MSVPKHPRCVQSLACSTFSWSGLEIMSIERTNERETNKNFGPRPPYWEFGRETEVRRKADSSGIRRNLICLGSFGSNFSNKGKPKHKPFPLGLFGSIWYDWNYHMFRFRDVFFHWDCPHQFNEAVVEVLLLSPYPAEEPANSQQIVIYHPCTTQWTIPAVGGFGPVCVRKRSSETKYGVLIQQFLELCIIYIIYTV